MASRPLIRESLFFLDLTGTDPYKLNSLRIIVTITVLLLGNANILLGFIFNWGGAESVDALTIAIAFFLVVVKIFTLLIYRDDLENVLIKMNGFWPTDKYGTDMRDEIETIYSYTRKAAKYMIIFIIIMVLFYFVLPLLGPIRELPYKSFYPMDLNQSPQFELVYVSNLLLTLVGVIGLLGTDGLFISLIINLLCEIKLIKHGFKKVHQHALTESEVNPNLKECYKVIDHHNLVLDCIKEVSGIYSAQLLVVYFLNMCCICSGLLAIIVSGFPPILADASKYGSLAMFYVMQLFFYCVIGNSLTDEAESISFDIYDTNWWIKTQPEYRKTCLMIIRRCNKKEELTAGGMFSLNLDSFRKVLRAALSFFTLLEAVYTDVGY